MSLALALSLLGGCFPYAIFLTSDGGDDPDTTEPVPTADSGDETGGGDTDPLYHDPDDTGATDTTAPDDTGTPDTTDIDTADTDAGTGWPDTWCYALAPSSSGELALLVFEMSTGAWSEVGRWPGAYEAFHTGGLATDGSVWAFAGYNGNDFSFYVIDPAAGTLTQGAPANYVVSVAWSGSEWVTVTSGEMQRYATVADLLTNTPSATVRASGFTRLGIDAGVVYGAWHSTNEIDLVDLYSGAGLGSIPLTDWDTWVWGVSVAGGKVHVIDDGRQYAWQRINSYDPATGALIESVAISGMPYSYHPSGLWCTDTAP